MANKIKTFRKSGYPVDEKNMDLFKNEWRNTCIKIEEKCGKDMLRAQKLYARVERILNKKYPTIEEWDYIRTKKKWKEVMEKYKAVMVLQHAETKELMYCIWDEHDYTY